MKVSLFCRWWCQALLGFSFLLGACGKGLGAPQLSERQIKARAMWQEHCKSSGEFIRRTVSNVDGLVLLKLRSTKVNLDNQFEMNDPYGNDAGGDGYVESFLRGHHDVRSSTGGSRSHAGYLFVDAIDPSDGKRYRYAGNLEEPWKTDKSYLKGYLRFVIHKSPVRGPSPRYGVTFEDISTREDREYWIAGSSLKVVDLETGEVIAERIGYMYDWAQGSRAGQRSPWLWAAESACPTFRSSMNSKVRVPAFVSQRYQTLEFVEKVLQPATESSEERK